jgi:hypothetical protein
LPSLFAEEASSEKSSSEATKNQYSVDALFIRAVSTMPSAVYLKKKMAKHHKTFLF